MNPLQTIITASIAAGKEILKIYHTDFSIEYKEDESPLTMADKNANEVIISFLKDTGIPVLSEEGRSISYEERKNWHQLWIVDPLDGTKEFIKRNDEFTVNIALVENHEPVMGVVYTPVLDILYVGEKSLGSFKIERASKKENLMNELNNNNRLPAINEKDYYGIVASRSHLNEETSQFIEEVKSSHINVKIVSKGSSLKLCMVAEGTADIYPRFAPTMEWDTAAGDAVVRASEGIVLQAKTETPLVYNKENLLNPWFIVKRKP
ncbi:MAG: 3'(2'),5'-bisphosphate nucleotidase [Bacteroidetes bacterium]|nr:MAG: 3'(2'),5'-bisphosphate nucleotidase [Bacteroidota bacterium]